MSTSTATRPTRSTHRPARIPAQRPAGMPAAVPATRTPRPMVRPATRPAGQGSVRLTRRGRIVLTLLMLGLVLGVLFIFSGQSMASGESGAPIPTRTVTVGEGDTLWAIATEVAGDGDIREAVHDIEQLNSLPGPALEVGQEIAVPIG
jgi:LysM repeat protein